MLTESVSQEVQREVQESKVTEQAAQEWYQVAAIPGKLKYDPKYPILGYSDLSSENVHDEGGGDEISEHEKCEVGCEKDIISDCYAEVTVTANKETKELPKCNVYDGTIKTAPVFEEKSNGDSNVLFRDVT